MQWKQFVRTLSAPTYGATEADNKYDIAKAVTYKLLRILRSPAPFMECYIIFLMI